jgi:hypothetical protein
MLKVVCSHSHALPPSITWWLSCYANTWRSLGNLRSQESTSAGILCNLLKVCKCLHQRTMKDQCNFEFLPMLSLPRLYYCHAKVPKRKPITRRNGCNGFDGQNPSVSYSRNCHRRMGRPARGQKTAVFSTAVPLNGRLGALVESSGLWHPEFQMQMLTKKNVGIIP